MGHLFDKGVMLTFEQIRQKYGLLRNHFFRYLQIRSFIQNQSRYDFDCQTSQMERLLLGGGKKALLGRGYTELNSASNMNLDYLRCKWNADLNLIIDESTWLEIWWLAREISICNRTRETPFRILYRLQITPQLRHRMNSSLSEKCLKCQVEVGSYRHCV